MGHPLKTIEQKLAKFFEEDLLFFSKKDSYTRIVALLISAVDEKSYERWEEKTAPNIIRIQLNPDILPQEIPNLKTICEKYLREFCQERGYTLSGPLQITIDSGKNHSEEIVVSAKHSKSRLGNTLRIHPAREDANKEISPLGFLILWNDEIFEINPAGITLGRDGLNDLVIDNLKVSRLHAQISVKDGRVWIIDHDSTQGTFVNGERVQKKQLYTGDVIKISDVPIIFCDAENFEDSYGSQTTKMDGVDK